jgi:hypothetical protein
MGQVTLTEPEIQRWLWLRAVEWCGFPAFISQPIVPILLIFFPVSEVIPSIIILGISWCSVRYAFVNVFIANHASIFVAFLKWPAAIGSFIYLLIHKQYLSGFVALLWPLVAGFISIPGKVGIIELSFAKKIGYVDQSASFEL